MLFSPQTSVIGANAVVHSEIERRAIFPLYLPEVDPPQTTTFRTFHIENDAMSTTGLGERQQTATNPPPETDLKAVGSGAGDKVIIAPSKIVNRTCAQFSEIGLLPLYSPPITSRTAKENDHFSAVFRENLNISRDSASRGNS